VEEKIDRMLNYHLFFKNAFDILEAEMSAEGPNDDIIQDYYMHVKNYYSYLVELQELLDEYFEKTNSPDIKYKRFQKTLSTNLKQVKNVLF